MGGRQEAGKEGGRQAGKEGEGRQGGREVGRTDSVCLITQN